MLTPEENQRFIQVGPGAPMGELLRRYWHPIAAVAEIDENPTKVVKLLGEDDLVLFRDLQGELGLIDRYCAHRRCPLEYGVQEEHGLRCPYHGWYYNTAGACIEQPFEDTVNPQARFKDRIHLRSYPVRELGGLLWTYLGPQPAPLLPEWSCFHEENAVHEIAFAVLDCNWLQVQENSVDPVHAEWLHGYYGQRRQAKSEAEALASGFTGTPTWSKASSIPRVPHAKIGFDVFEYGIVKRRVVVGGSEKDDSWVTGHRMIFPNILSVGGSYQWRVPMDDTHTLHVTYYSYYPAPGSRAPEQAEIPYRYVPVQNPDGTFLHQDVVLNQDFMAWVGQGAVARRDLERLTEVDAGIILFRQLLQRQAEVALDGGDPMNVFRTPGTHVIDAMPTEREAFGTGSGRRQAPRYYPHQGSETKALPDIEKTLATWAEPEPEPAG